LASASRRAPTTGLKVRLEIDAFVVAFKFGNRARVKAGRAESQARFREVPPTVAVILDVVLAITVFVSSRAILVTTILGVPVLVTVLVLGLTGLRGRVRGWGSRRRGDRRAPPKSGGPFPAGRALGRSRVLWNGILGDATATVIAPLVVVRWAVGALGRAGRLWLAANGKAALLVTPPEFRLLATRR